MRPGTCLLAQLLRCFRGVAVQVLVEVPEVEVGELLLVRQQWARWRWVRDVSAATSSSLVRHLGVTGTGVTVQAATTAAWVAKLRPGTVIQLCGFLRTRCNRMIFPCRLQELVQGTCMARLIKCAQWILLYSRVYFLHRSTCSPSIPNMADNPFPGGKRAPYAAAASESPANPS